MKKYRSGGILMHITSLPGKEGIGTLGKHAYQWIDFLHETDQKIWQILPLGPVAYGNCPYQCFSAFGGNPLLVDLFFMKDDGFLSENELENIPRFDLRQVDFAKVEKWKFRLLRKAYEEFSNYLKEKFVSEFNSFLDENGWWLNDYALFMAARKHFGNLPWQQWPAELKIRQPEALQVFNNKLSEEIEFQKFVQFVFFRQWKNLRDYARSKNVVIIGDLPLYVAGDSADVWANPGIFLLDNDLKPTSVGGVPPDYFSKTGQLWGNPLFDWEKLKQQDYHWWLARIHFNLRMFDLVRIDHFRGLEAFWSVPADEENAVNGHWADAQGYQMLRKLQQQIGTFPLIAEDLGLITPEVEQLRDSFDLPGMKVLQFAFTSDETNEHLPHNFKTNMVVYTGTHDNDTAWGWLNSALPSEKKFAMSYLRNYPQKTVWALIEMAWASVALQAVIPLQDLLELGAEARMNIPGLAIGNWGWRFRWDQLRGRHRRFLKEITKKYNRV